MLSDVNQHVEVRKWTAFWRLRGPLKDHVKKIGKYQNVPKTEIVTYRIFIVCDMIKSYCHFVNSIMKCFWLNKTKAKDLIIFFNTHKPHINYAELRDEPAHDIMVLIT